MMVERWDPLNQSLGKSSTVFALKEEKKASPEVVSTVLPLRSSRLTITMLQEIARKMEEEVHSLFEQSTILHNDGYHSRALDKVYFVWVDIQPQARLNDAGFSSGEKGATPHKTSREATAC